MTAIARAKGIDFADLEVWFGDEARIGQKNKLTRRWARRGTRPSAPLDQRTASTYIFGAICPKDGKGAGLVLPWCNIEAMAHQLRDCTYAIEAGDTVFAPRMKALLLRAVVLARRSRHLAESTRREYRRRLECALDAVMALAPTHRDGQRLRKRYGKVRSHLFTFLDHPEVPADNNGSERELRPTATYRKVTGGFRSKWGADLFAGVRSVIGTAARRGVGAYQAIQQTLRVDARNHPRSCSQTEQIPAQIRGLGSFW